MGKRKLLELKNLGKKSIGNKKYITTFKTT
jgi:hypothetical protein